MKYNLTKDNYEISVDTLGAELTELKKDGVNYLWTKTPPFWQRHAPVLFPIVGKLKNNSYVYEGREYSLSQHGFARDSEFELVAETSNSLEFRLIENKNPNYPFDFNFFITYTLSTEGLRTSYRIVNEGSKVLPFSVGAHPGFLCPLNTGENLEDYFFEFEADDYLHRTKLQDGLLTDIEQQIALADRIIPISEFLFKDDALVLSKFKSKWVTLKSKTYSLKVSWDDCTYLGLWKQPNAPFVCIEPWWGVTDEADTNSKIIEKRGIHLLNPKDEKSFWFEMMIG